MFIPTLKEAVNVFRYTMNSCLRRSDDVNCMNLEPVMVLSNHKHVAMGKATMLCDDEN